MALPVLIFSKVLEVGMLKKYLISESCPDGEECIASKYCHSVLNLMLGKRFSPDPELRQTYCSSQAL